MTGKRQPIEEFHMNVLSIDDNNDLVYKFDIDDKDVVCVMWGSLCYRIIREQLCCDAAKPCKDNGACKIGEYCIPTENKICENESEFKSYLVGKQLNITLARLIFVDKDKFNFEFEVSTTFGCSPTDFDSKNDAGKDWIKPRCVKLKYPKVSNFFQPEDVFNESRLRTELGNKYLKNHSNSGNGNITGAFFCINRLDCVEHILLPFYKNRANSSDITDIVTQARIAKRGDFKGPVTKMNQDKVKKFWNYTYYEYGQDRQLSYLLKAGKCPIDAVSR